MEEIIIILALILLNGVLSMTEMAFVSSRKYRSEADDRFLSTIQIGITLISILTGLFSGNALAERFAAVLSRWGVSAQHSEWIAKTLIVLVVTYCTLVLGELVPKRIAMAMPDKVAGAMRGFMRLLGKATSPFVWLLSQTTKGVMHLFGMGKMMDAKVTEEEIKALIEEGKEDGEVEEVEQELVGRVFNLGDRTIESIMTHRSELVWLDVDDAIDDQMSIIRKDLHGVYPVASEQLDELVGVVDMKDLVGRMNDPDFNLRSVVKPPLFVPGTTSVYSAIEQIRSHYSKYALVTDEFGSIQGMVTHTDIMEALIGELPENNEDHDIVLREDGSSLVDGQCDFYAFLEHFDMEDLAAEYDYNTLSGLILDELEHIPSTGEKLQWQGLTLEIIDMDKARIDKVLVTPSKSTSQN